MASRLPETLTREQLLSVLAALAAAGVLAVTVLLVVTKATVVRIELRLDEVSLTVLPPPQSTVDLLHPELEVRDLQWKGADRFEATLAEPRAGRATADLDETSVIGLGADAVFRPEVRLRRPARLKLVPSRRGDLTMTFDPVAGAPDDPGWVSEVLPRGDFVLRLRNVDLVIDTERFPDAEAKLEPAAAAIFLSGGTMRTELGLTPVVEPQGLTTVRFVEPLEGLRLKLPPGPNLIPVGERLVLLEREPEDPEAGALLAPNLDVVAASLYRRTGLRHVSLHEESFLEGGRIRFPGGEKEPVELERGTFLRLPDRTRLRLESLRMVNGEIELVLWAKPASLKAGPTPGLMSEVLPSVFVWLSTHRLALVFGVLGTFMAAVLGLLRLLGLVRKEE
jgi:hypothetical protein